MSTLRTSAENALHCLELALDGGMFGEGSSDEADSAEEVRSVVEELRDRLDAQVQGIEGMPPGPWTLGPARTIETPLGVFYLTYSSEPRTGKPHFDSPTVLDEIARRVAELQDTRDELRVAIKLGEGALKACGIAQAFHLGAQEADGDVGMTYDGDRESPRSRAYDEGRTLAQEAAELKAWRDAAVERMKKLEQCLGTLAAYLKETHTNELERKHYGDPRGEKTCSYCVAMAEARELAPRAVEIAEASL